MNKVLEMRKSLPMRVLFNENDNVFEPLSFLSKPTLGNAWFSGITPDGNFTLGTTYFDGNDTSSRLFLARIAPTGIVDHLETLGKT